MSNERETKLQTLLIDAIENFEAASPRTKQSRDGILGPSDIGFCRQKAALVTRQVQPTDKVSHWAAAVGTAVHSYVEAAYKKADPTWLVGSIDKIRVSATLPSGAVISGSPDVVVPAANAVLDIKTVNGFEWTKRNGPSKSHQYQRHLYAMGLVDAGILDGTKPLYVGNLYYDRSGAQADPLVFLELFNPDLTDEINSWVTDVIYAVENGQDSSRDVAAATCEKICEFFTVCRGALEVHDGQEVIEDGTLLEAVQMYVEGRDMENLGKQMKKEAGHLLSNTNGVTPAHQVRWVSVNPTLIEGFERAGYARLDVRKRRNS